MSDNPFRKQADKLIEDVAELQRQVLVKHSTGLLAAIYEEREKWKHRAETTARELAQARAELAAEEIRHGQSINCQKIERARAEKAEADNKALREDAERYRWLRGHCNSMSVAPPLTVARVCGYGLEGWSGDNLDAAIDAARKGG